MSLNYRLVQAAREGDYAQILPLIEAGADPSKTVRGALDYGGFLDQVTPLMIAAGSPRSNPETVRQLLAAGPDPLQTASGDVTATWFAAGGGTRYALTPKNVAHLEPHHPYWNWGGGDVERLRLLLDAGGDLNETASNGRSLIGEACGIGDPQRVRLLIERGASLKPPAGGNDVGICLFLAAESGCTECVRLLLEANFPPHWIADGKSVLD